jgi:hypothetical protein
MLNTLALYVAAGLSTIPCRQDKRPLVAWESYQSHLPSADDLRAWAGLPVTAVALVGGPVSGGLEVLDFDAPELFAPWVEEVRSTAPLLLGDLPTVRTPRGGYHVYFRSPQPEGNRKLAVGFAADGNRKTLIETRGTGGYALTAPTPGYTLLNGELVAIPAIGAADRALLLDTARAFTQVPEVSATPRPQPQQTRTDRGLRPGDDYNLRGDPRVVLEAAGWQRTRVSGDTEYWRRPGKQSSWSATLNALSGLPGYLYVFSSNAWPFEPGRAYSPFAVFALLEHEGDFRRASRALCAMGYGKH